MKAKWIGLLGGIVLFTSCSSDEGGGSITQENLTRKWYQVSFSYGGSSYSYPGHESCAKDYVEFAADGTLRNVDIVGCNESVVTGSWSLDGKNITIETGDETDVVVVKKLTATTLKLQQHNDINGDGTLETIVTTYSNY